MRILFIDIASHHGTLACVTENETAAITTVDHRIGDSELLPVFAAVLKKAGWEDKDLTHIACVTGPGGFTSLRVGVSFANALAHTLEIPSVGIHLSDIYAARVFGGDWTLDIGKNKGGQYPMSNIQHPFLWLHSTKSTAMFIRGFGDLSQIWPEPTLVSTDDLTSMLPEKTSWTGEAIETHRALLDAKNATVLPIKNLEDILPAFLEKLHYEKALLQPWYGREG